MAVVSGGETEEYGPDEGQQGAFARFVGTVENRHRAHQRADAALVEVTEAVQVELFYSHPFSSSSTSAARHSSSAATRSSNSSSFDGRKFLRKGAALELT